MTEIKQFVDLTTLSGSDTNDNIKNLCELAIEKNVAAVCVFPTFIKVCRQHLPKDFPIATVVGGFPHGEFPLK